MMDAGAAPNPRCPMRCAVTYERDDCMTAERRSAIAGRPLELVTGRSLGPTTRPDLQAFDEFRLMVTIPDSLNRPASSAGSKTATVRHWT